MSEQEFMKIAIAVKSAYPNAKVLADKNAMELWYRMLSDLDYRLVQNAVQEHIATNKFAPAIAEIREQCAGRLQVMHDWNEAWGQVMKAIRDYGSYREVEALESMDDLTRKVVKRFGFQNLCMSENIVADRAHFKSAYEGMVKESKNQLQLPKFVQDEKMQFIASNQMALAKKKLGEIEMED